MILPFAMSMMMPMAAKADHVLYFTDLEGSRERLEDFYATSGGFVLGPDGRHHLQKGVILVYGGDVPDRYLGTLHLIEELNRHFDENPGRMFALAGNRDVNKMRFTNELSTAALSRPPVYADRVKAELVAEETSLPPDRARRMKFILGRTMGAPEAFELLRRELAERLGLEAGDVTDDEVVAAYLDVLKPGGALTRLLERMVLGLRLGSNLFVHGGVTAENLGAEPVDDWLNRLNTWYRAELEVWKAHYLEWSGEGPRFGEDLIEYPMPKPGARSKPESVVTGRHVDLQNNPLPPATDVREALLERGIRREIVGHTPIGDMAIVVRPEDQSFESIFADNSYSRREGNATWIWLSGEDFERASVRGRVRLGDDAWTEIRAETTLGAPSRVGQRTDQGERVIGHDPTGREVVTRMVDFEITNRVLECARGLEDV